MILLSGTIRNYDKRKRVVWDAPGLGIEIDKKGARQYLAEEDKKFFD